MTTIDPKMQKAAYNGMLNGCSGGCRGAVVALKPNTGKILALVSTPSYDPNKLASHDRDVRGRLGAVERRRLGDQPDAEPGSQSALPTPGRHSR